MLSLKAKGIGTQVHYIPIYTQPYYKNLYGEMRLPGAEEYYSRCLSIPLYAGLEPYQVENTIMHIKNL